MLASADSELDHGPRTERSATMRMCAVSREVRPIEWLWEGRIPLAKCSLLVGDPDAGKSFVTLDLAARVTRGDGVPPEGGLARPGSVLILSADDHVEDTILPRLLAAGADLGRVALLPRTVRGKDEGGGMKDEKDGRQSSPDPRPTTHHPLPPDDRLLSLATDIDRVEQALDELADCRLVIVDPISAYLRGVDTYNNAAVRRHLLSCRIPALPSDICQCQLPFQCTKTTQHCL